MPGQLRAEQFLLQVGVVQFGVGIGDFHALDEQLKPLRNSRVVTLSLRERADARRIIHDEDRARQAHPRPFPRRRRS